MPFDQKIKDYFTSDSITFTETIDLGILKSIVENFNEVYPLIGKLKDKKTHKQITDQKTALTILKTRLKKHKTNEFVYKSKHNERLQPDGYSLCSMNKILRHTLAGETHYDIDIVNAHPSFLLWVARNSNWPCKYLAEYVEKREEFLGKIQSEFSLDRDTSKDLVLSLLFDQNKVIEPKCTLYDLYQEIKKIQDNIKEQNKDIYARSRTDRNNRKGSCMSKYLQIIENKICQVMFNFCAKNGIHVSAPCYDGILISKADCDNFEGGLESLLKKIEIEVETTLDIRITLKEKEMTLGINKQLQEIIALKTPVKGDYIDPALFSDQTIGTYVINKMIDDEMLYYDDKLDDLYYFDETTALFVKQKKNFLMTKISQYVNPYIDNLICGEELSAETGIMINKIRNKIMTTKDQKNIFTQMELRLPKNSEFISSKFNRTPYLFPIRDNKIIDFRTDTIRDRTKTDYFTFFVDVEYDQDVDEEEVITWLKDYLIPSDKEDLDEDDLKHINCFLDFNGYLATGENNLKVIGIYKGIKDTGKSTVSAKFNEVFGLEKFVSMVHKKVICESRSSSVHESELFNLRFSRVGFLSELKDTDKANEDFIKRVSGNDKFIPARKCGAKEQELLTLDFKMVIPTNNMWESSDPALQSRLKFFEFMNYFDKDAPNKDEIENYIKNLDVASVVFKRANKFYSCGKTISWSKQVNQNSIKEINQLDPIKQFMEDFIVETEDDKDRLAMADVFALYSKENPHDELSRHKNKFYKRFEENLPPGNNRYNKLFWKGLAFKPQTMRTQRLL